jgi:hypothetical protein
MAAVLDAPCEGAFDGPAFREPFLKDWPLLFGQFHAIIAGDFHVDAFRGKGFNSPKRKRNMVFQINAIPLHLQIDHFHQWSGHGFANVLCLLVGDFLAWVDLDNDGGHGGRRFPRRCGGGTMEVDL